MRAARKHCRCGALPLTGVFALATLCSVQKRNQELAGSRKLHPRTVRRDAVGQTHVPTPFAAVNPHHHCGGGGFMIDRFIQQQEVWPQLRDRQGKVVNKQAHIHLGGVSTLSR
jgi:hypothetical protein